jgi:hypothetical protein
MLLFLGAHASVARQPHEQQRFADDWLKGKEFGKLVNLILVPHPAAQARIRFGHHGMGRRSRTFWDHRWRSNLSDNLAGMS